MKYRLTFRLALLLVAPALCVSSCDTSTRTPTSTIIVGATIFDGTGSDGFSGNVRIDGDQIVEVGDVLPIDGETVIDANGLVLAPGFIDTHGHYYDSSAEFRDMPAVLSQGITTIVTGMDGFSSADDDLAHVPVSVLTGLFKDNPVAVNVASYAAHNSIRFRVMGDDYRRSATEAEVQAMAELVEADMASGAVGLSTGLEYEPGIFSTIEEVIALAGVAARFGGSYSTHMRDEDDQVLESIEEVIRIGRAAELPVHISHIKIADRAQWGSTDTVLALLDGARDEGVEITADIYPYDRWASNLAILFPDRDFTSSEWAEFTFEHTASPDEILLSYYAPNPRFEGLTVADVARLTENDPVSTLLELTQAADEYYRQHGRWGVMIIARGMDEQDIERFMQWPHTNICTDGGYSIAHPRSYGSFPRVIRRFVEERETLTMAEAIHKMTGLSANAIGFADRGLLRSGMLADLVLFDPESIGDRATMENPRARSTGIEKVWVNGVLAYTGGEPTRRYPGRIVRHQRPAAAGPNG